MTKEEKDLLLKDLCARFPYGVNVLLDLEKQFDGGSICTLTSIDAKTSNAIFHVDVTLMDLQIEEIRPYLRSMSSMTEEEEKEVRILWNEDFVDKRSIYHCYPKTTDFYNKHHLDYRGLIEKGLALEAPKDMYNTKTE